MQVDDDGNDDVVIGDNALITTFYCPRPLPGQPELQNVTDMTHISVLKYLQVWVKSLGKHAIWQNYAFF